jgi:AcrR family transcriptional regulator
MTTVSQAAIEPMKAVNAEPPVLTRVERRKQDTRARILVAAETLMRANPIDGVTIQDITDTADVGHGSFYLHFKSKYEVLIPIIHAHATSLDQKLQKVIPSISDPAEVMAVSARYMARMIVADELWKWFLRHSGVPSEEIQKAVGRFSDRDFAQGYRSGRFKVNDPTATRDYAFGGLVNCLMTAFDTEDPLKLIDDGTELMLRVFGLSPEQANEIAHRQLPKLEKEL